MSAWDVQNRTSKSQVLQWSLGILLLDSKAESVRVKCPGRKALWHARPFTQPMWSQRISCSRNVQSKISLNWLVNSSFSLYYLPFVTVCWKKEWNQLITQKLVSYCSRPQSFATVAAFPWRVSIVMRIRASQMLGPERSAVRANGPFWVIFFLLLLLFDEMFLFTKGGGLSRCSTALLKGSFFSKVRSDNSAKASPE